MLLLTASTSGLWGVPGRAPYVAAKWGVVGLMKTLAMELGPAVWYPRQRALPWGGRRASDGADDRQ